MTISIRDPEVNRLAEQIMRYTGETITQILAAALKERLAYEERRTRLNQEQLVQDALSIGQRCAASTKQSNASDADILGLDTNGVPKNDH